MFLKVVKKEILFTSTNPNKTIVLIPFPMDF